MDRKVLLLVASLLLFMSKTALGDELSELKTQMQKMQEENKALQEQLNKQREITEQLLKKMESIENKFLVGKDEQEIKSVIEDVLAEKEEEKILAGLLSEGGLENMIFHGYADLEWKGDEFDRAQGGSGDHNFFDNHHFNLWFGYRLADNLVAKGEVEIEHAGDDWKLEFADIEWKPFSNDKLELLLGKIIVPLGVEQLVHASVWNKLISRPLPSISIIPGTYGDVGIEARGWLPSYDNAKLRYHLYLVNGLGDDDANNVYEQKELKRTKDNNNNKAVGAQIAILPIKGLEIGGSGYLGKWDDQDKSDTFILAPHLIYSADPVELKAEYIHQHIEHANGPNSKDADLRGLYIQGAYNLASLHCNDFLNKWELVARYDWLKNEDRVLNLKQGNIPFGKSEQRFAIGAIFRPQDHLQFKLEYLYRNNKGMNEDDDKDLALQAVVYW